MDKQSVDIDALVVDLRNYYYFLDACGDSNPKLATMIENAADALEQYHRSSQFHSFVWKTLGHTTMRQLIDMYREEQEETES